MIYLLEINYLEIANSLFHNNILGSQNITDDDNRNLNEELIHLGLVKYAIVDNCSFIENFSEKSI